MAIGFAAACLTSGVALLVIFLLLNKTERRERNEWADQLHTSGPHWRFIDAEYKRELRKLDEDRHERARVAREWMQRLT